MPHTTILRKGAILAAFFIAITLLQWGLGMTYLSDKRVNTTMWVMTTLITLGFGAFNIQEEKKKTGFIALKDAFALLFLPILIALIANGIFKIVLFNYVDPAYIEMNRKFTVENIMKIKDQLIKTFDKKTFDKMLQEAKGLNPYALQAVGISITIHIFGYLLPALILASLLKKNAPIHED